MSKPVNRQTDRQTDVDKNITLFVLCTLSVEDVKKERDNVVEPVESSEVKSKVVRLLTNVTISFFAILIPSFSLCVITAICPGGPALAGTEISPSWILMVEPKMMLVVPWW